MTSRERRASPPRRGGVPVREYAKRDCGGRRRRSARGGSR